jgi:hypothetical protein
LQRPRRRERIVGQHIDKTRIVDSRCNDAASVGTFVRRRRRIDRHDDARQRRRARNPGALDNGARP